ncbi:MAG: glycoside hydrolase family protein [Alphaproteobacteria bacterium]|nr:glycoside hydrolase family protein [Alphaproteobacteria bacterium]
MKTPQFLRRLMSSSEYMDKNSKVYAMAEKYLNLLYPGMVQTDATGRMTEPEYDMTLEQFCKAQDELDDALEKAKQEAEAEYEEAGRQIDVEDYVELEEAIDVRVLMPFGTIENKRLMVYTLDMPEPDDDDDTPNDKPRRVWRWHSEDGDNTCNECVSRDGEIYDSEDEIPSTPVHPNCRCSITEDVIAPDGRTLSSKPYTPKEKKNEIEKDIKNMKMSDEGINWLKSKEDKVLDKNGNHVIYDDRTRQPVPDGAPLPPGATIGYGHLIKPGEDFRGGITETEAINLLRADISTAEHAVRDNITVPITQNQYDALVSLAYNIGGGAFASSTVVQYINNPDFTSSKYPSLESAWRAWNRTQGAVSNGLINRRNDEWNMYNNGAY